MYTTFVSRCSHLSGRGGGEKTNSKSQVEKGEIKEIMKQMSHDGHTENPAVHGLQ